MDKAKISAVSTPTIVKTPLDSSLLIIGITGSTRSGKSTLAKGFLQAFGESKCQIIMQDKFFDRVAIASRNGNWELPECINFENMIKAVDEKIKELLKLPGQKYLILEGFQLFSDQRLIDLTQVKIWLELSEKTIHFRRMHSTWVPQEYFDEFLIPAYRDYKKRCESIKDVHVINGELELEEVFDQAMAIVKQAIDSKAEASLMSTKS